MWEFSAQGLGDCRVCWVGRVEDLGFRAWGVGFSSACIWTSQKPRCNHVMNPEGQSTQCSWILSNCSNFRFRTSIRLLGTWTLGCLVDAVTQEFRGRPPKT